MKIFGFTVLEKSEKDKEKELNYKLLKDFNSNIKSINKYKLFFYYLLPLFEYQKSEMKFYFNNLHPELIEFFSKIKYIKISETELGQKFVKLLSYDEKYIQIGKENSFEIYVEKNKNSIYNRDSTEEDFLDNDIFTIYNFLFLDMIFHLADKESYSNFKVIINNLKNL